MSSKLGSTGDITDGDDSEERMALDSGQLYLRGNRVFMSGGNTEEALALYAEALTRLKRTGCDEQQSWLKLKLCSNAALCHLLLRNYQEAVGYCSTVLLLDEDNLKAFARRAKAHEQLGNFEHAIEDIKSCLRIYKRDPDEKYHPITNPRPVSVAEKDAVTTLRRLQRMAVRDLEVQRAEVNARPVSFVTNSQTLRLNFGCTMPTTIVTGSKYTFRLFVANEFGLWNRADIISCKELDVKPRISCEVIPLLTIEGSNLWTVRSTPSNCVGVDGRVDFEFEVESANSVSYERYVLLKFSVDKPLPGGRVISPVVSLPVLVRRTTPTEKVSKYEANTHGLCEIATKCAKLGGQSVKTFDPSFATKQDSHLESHVVYAVECPGSLGIGGKVWDATYGLLEYFTHHGVSLGGKVVVELGSGTGLAGLGLCDIFCRSDGCHRSEVVRPIQVFLTDTNEVVPLLELNILLNKEICRLAETCPSHHALRFCRSHILQTYRAMTHCWGENIDRLNVAITNSYLSSSCQYKGLIVVASDVVYDQAGYRPLVNTISRLLHHHQSVYAEAVQREVSCQMEPPFLVLAHRHRSPENVQFFDMLSSDEARLVVDRQDMQWKHTPSDVEVFLVRPKS